MSEKRIKCYMIIKTITAVIFAALMGLTLFLHFTFSDREAAPELFGVTVFQMHSHEMEPVIPDRTAVFLQKTGSDTLKEGSVVLCSIGSSRVLMRIYRISDQSGSITYYVGQDTADSEYAVSYDDIIGKAKAQSRFIGSVLYFLSSARGLAITAAVWCLLLFTVFRRLPARPDKENHIS